MATSIQYEVPTWNQIYDRLLLQAQKIHGSNFKADLIVAIARGGLIPARIFTDLLQTKELTTITIQYYVGIGKTRTQPLIKQCLTTPLAAKKVLLVDDISDGGKSLQLAKEHLRELGAAEIKIATLYRKPKTQTPPDFCEKETDCWVVFPWDTKETIRKILQTAPSKDAASQEIAKLINAGLPKQLAEKLTKELTQDQKPCNTT